MKRRLLRLLPLCIPLLTFLLTACPAASSPTPTPTPVPEPTIMSFTATPSILVAGGGDITLAWEVKDFETLSIDGGVGAVTGTSKVVNVTRSKTFTLTATNESGSATQSVSVSVAETPPPTETFPRIKSAGVFSLEAQNGSPCSSIPVTFGTTLDLRDKGCDDNPVRYSALVDIENPSAEDLTYTWTLFITDQDQDFEYLVASNSSEPSFALRNIHNSGLGTFDCRVIVQVNAPDPSRSKSQSVWQGKCTLNTFTLN
jgi:hypothetical protein